MATTEEGRREALLDELARLHAAAEQEASAWRQYADRLEAALREAVEDGCDLVEHRLDVLGTRPMPEQFSVGAVDQKGHPQAYPWPQGPTDVFVAVEDKDGVVSMVETPMGVDHARDLRVTIDPDAAPREVKHIDCIVLPAPSISCEPYPLGTCPRCASPEKTGNPLPEAEAAKLLPRRPSVSPKSEPQEPPICPTCGCCICGTRCPTQTYPLRPTKRGGPVDTERFKR